MENETGLQVLTRTFEGQDVKVKTDKGKVLINLACTAKVCGLVHADRGKERISWKNRNGIVDKLKKIYGANAPQDIKDEINNILNEIENADNRNTIYMSTWLTKRLAVECNNDKANEYKNFLVTLDENRDKNQVQINNVVDPRTVLQLAQGVQLIGSVVEGMQKSMFQIQDYVKDSINAKDLQINEIAELVGLRSKNTMTLAKELKEKLSKIYGQKIYASNPLYIKAKEQVFKEYKVCSWEQIPVGKFNEVFAYIDTLEDMM